MEDKEYAGDYRIEQSFTFVRHHFVIGIDDNADEKYLLNVRQLPLDMSIRRLLFPTTTLRS